MDLPAIDNHSDLLIEPFVLLEKDGEKLVTIVKATFELDEADGLLLVPPERQRGVRFADVMWGDAATSAPKYPCDACGNKPGTDVVVVACGHAPDGQPLPSFDVAVRVGALKKSLVVHGLRVWLANGSGLSAARPTLCEEIRYDLAYGGIDSSDPNLVLEEPRNPVGLGVVADRSRLTHQRGPSIEDPAHAVLSADVGTPAGFGPLGPHWAPRRQHAGTFDEARQRDQCPLLPNDRDDRANLCASPGLVATPHLRGDEDVALLNLVPGGGLLQFALPSLRPRLTHRVREREQQQLPELDTVVIDTVAVTAPSRVTVELLWRTVQPAPRRMKDTTITLQMEGRG